MLQRDEVIGGPMLDRLERSDRSAELKPALRIPDGQVEQMLRRADLFGGKQRQPTCSAWVITRSASSGPAVGIGSAHRSTVKRRESADGQLSGLGRTISPQSARGAAHLTCGDGEAGIGATEHQLTQ